MLCLTLVTHTELSSILGDRFVVKHPTNSSGHIKTGPRLLVSSDRLELEIEPEVPSLHYITTSPRRLLTQYMPLHA